MLFSLSNFATSLSLPASKYGTSRSAQKLYHNDCSERRSFLAKSASVVGIVTTGTPPTSAIEIDPASTIPSAPFATGNFEGLLDLPPITPGCVRLYLCRHGQTENNRLHLVQGARVDPSINGNGYEQAQRLGTAVARLTNSSGGGGQSGVVPKLAAHSKLRRARETAEVLTSTAASSHSTAVGNKESNMKIYGEVPSLGEVDFGSLEGTDVESFRRTMRNTFASWSLGDIDRRTGGGGESGREVLERAASSLEELSKIASSPTNSSSSSLLAVSHSTYLRILLALVNDTSLAESVLWKIQNGSANVVDVNIEGKRRLVTSTSGIFGGEIVGRFRGSSNGLELDIPEAHLIRRNEVRHLEGMDV